MLEKLYIPWVIVSNIAMGALFISPVIYVFNQWDPGPIESGQIFKANGSNNSPSRRVFVRAHTRSYPRR